MKRLLFSLMLMLPLVTNAQAHLGATVKEITSSHPDNVFLKDDLNGREYIYTDMRYGTFYYHFNDETGLSKMCFQIPHNMVALNAQVEIYNKQYVIISETSWKAYLKDGGVMKINLHYDNETGIYMFAYTD